MNQSEDIKDLATALAKAQGQLEDAVKDTSGHNYKYADLASVYKACRKQLSENGLSVIQFPTGGPEVITVRTRIMHSSGQWMEDSLTLKPTKFDAQGAGSAITYARRYSLMAVVGISADDDDGAAASQTGGQSEKKSKPSPTPIQSGDPGAPSPTRLKTQINKELRRLKINWAQAGLKAGIQNLQDSESPEELAQVLDLLRAEQEVKQA